MESIQDILAFLETCDWTTWLVWCCVVLLCVLGMIGTVVPALPGIPLIFAGLLLAAWQGDFQLIGGFKLIVAGILTVISLVIDWVSQMMGAKRSGASRYGIAGALVGTVIGLFFGFIGIVFFPLFGAVAGELVAKRDFAGAGVVGIATWLGMLVGIAFKLAIGLTLIAMLAMSVF